MRDAAGPHARRTRVAQHFEHLVIADPDNLLWLTGYRDRGGPTYLMLAERRWFLLAPESTVPSLPDVEVISMSSPRQWTGIPRSARVNTLSSDMAIEDGTLLTALGEPQLHDIGAEIEALRQIKDPDEIALIRENVALLSQALRAIEPLVRTAATEMDLWLGLEARLVHLIDGDVELTGNLASGEQRTREDDPHATARHLQDGDIILLDAYPRMRGYYADLTRTWCRGKPCPELVQMHAGVLAALNAVAAALRPGLSGHEVDALARMTLGACGLDPSFPHHTGHGFGVKQQEEPWLRSGSPAVLQAGMIVAIEPACYSPGVGGVRLEQDFLITESGARPLGDGAFSLGKTHMIGKADVILSRD